MTTSIPLERSIQSVLKQYFGYDTFRNLQAEIIETVISGRNTIVLMPTGGGKSLCFQIPAIAMKGTGVVISPLIALMKDQVEALKANGVNAEFINSSQSISSQNHIIKRAIAGELDLLYLSPERILSQDMVQLLKQLTINLIAVDEAHCISQWGHDFRPEYAQLKNLKEYLRPGIPWMALTATADKVTRDDILERLDMKDATSFISSFDRPNLHLQVHTGPGRMKVMERFLTEHPGEAGIIYCLSRRMTEKVADTLSSKGYKASAYHAGMDNKSRSDVQEKFLKDEIRIICATIAFGMGIDKPNVRFVVHYSPPQSMEHFYQEIGRAGRDGLPASTFMFFNWGDFIMYREMFEESENRDIKLEKLGRIAEYAQSPVCRRKIILHYFNEDLDHDCGNCDICENPPRRFDGTILAQKALSAVSRLRQKEPVGTIIDVLRGASRKEILDKHYHQIKTFGVGKDITYDNWKYYFQQLVALGYLEPDIRNNNHLLLTQKASRILFENEKVQLSAYVAPEVSIERKKYEPKISKSESFENWLQMQLFELRKEMAAEEGLPPATLFSDVTLLDLKKKLPVCIYHMPHISGMGEAKLEKYGETLAAAVRRFIIQATNLKIKKVNGATFLETYEYLMNGKSIEQVADLKGIQSNSVFMHMAKLIEFGFEIPKSPWLSEEEIKIIKDLWITMNQPEDLKPMVEFLGGGKYTTGTVKLALAERNEDYKTGLSSVYGKEK
jgi:ATP-dependent DNA helicase RecQ